MTYDETITYLYNSVPMFHQVGSSAYKEGMENSFLIDEQLGHPHRNYKTIHVAGTNGKGSTSHLLASVLQEAGYKVGLYTSPHLLDFRERIRVNGQPITQEYVVEFVARHRSFSESIQPSFFELTTGMAFAYFADQAVDIAVIEVGLGGRLDCTNVITPILSIITNISLDHTNLLGTTPAAIAREKAGIIKPGVPVVIGEAEGEVRDIFSAPLFCGEGQGERSSCGEEEPQRYFVQDERPILEAQQLPSGYWEFETKHYKELIDQLGGLAQEKNAATVLCAIEVLQGAGINIPAKAVYKGFRHVIENTGLMGRWQLIGYNPKIIFDTAHNVGGIDYIVRQLERERYQTLHIVFGMVNDKDVSAVLQRMPEEAVYYFTQAQIPRALDSQALREQAAAYGLKGAAYPTVGAAFAAAKQAAGIYDFIFVGGSTFVVADALAEV